MSVRIIKNTVETMTFTVVEDDPVTGLPTTTRVDLTALPLEYFLTPRTGVGSNDPAISKVTGDFTLLDQGVAATKGQATLKLTASETALLVAVIHVATLFVTEASNRRRVLYEHVAIEEEK